MIETIIIVAVVAILALISAPSFASLLDSMRLDQSITELRTSLSSAQRQAIRSGQSCLAGIRVQNSDGGVLSATPFQSLIVASCQSEQEVLPQKISVVSNMKAGSTFAAATGTSQSSETSTEGSSSEEQEFWEQAAAWACENYGWFCSPESSQLAETRVVDVEYGEQGRVHFGVVSDQQPPADPAGKIVAFISTRPEGKKKCIAISRRVGLTRIGNYSGSYDPNAMTNGGICTSVDWKQQ